MTTTLVSNVSDTARWIAACRAWESERADALFRDPLASRLAGDQGRAIASASGRSMRTGWPMVVRTKIIDDLVLAAVTEGCDRVLNLAAGLDTRPYRMDLPPTLEWIEADLPALVDEKLALLAGETPKCRLSHERIDLTDASARAEFLDRAVAGASRVLVLTEGLLIYLDETVVRAIAEDFRSRPSIHWWMMDLTSPAIVKMMQRRMGEQFVNAPMKFAPRDGVGYFEAMGWKAVEIRPIFHSAARYRRLPVLLRLFALFPEPNPRNVERARWSAVVRFERE